MWNGPKGDYHKALYIMTQTVRLLIKNPEEICQEVRAIVTTMFPNFDFADFNMALADVDALFSGQTDGFEPCDTMYHDWGHTLGTLLATARLLHGVHLNRQELSARTVNLALIAALFHDSGYIRRSSESSGTGGQFTRHHVQRGVDLLEDYGHHHGWSINDFMDMEPMLHCTDPARIPESILFMNSETMLAGHVLATADIVSQMADDIYLEKLPYLFLEFSEAGITDFSSEYDLFMKTMGFYAFMRAKMESRLSNVIGCMASHFQARHGIDRDLYSEAAQRNIDYLFAILEKHGEDYRDGLRRSLDRDEFPVKVAA